MREQDEPTRDMVWSWLANRPVGGRIWNIWRAIIGVAYLVAATFNASYTLPRSDELDGYAR